ncbi:MAG: matrixin family metalloprotease [Deltaproteobacteria bacterium]|nr:matrixin family metalloprotease [Deltaproteobacteria bacterium]
MFVMIIAVMLCGSAQECDAYAFTGKKWSGAQASFLVNTEFGPDGSLSAIQNAMATWTDVATASFVLTYAGATDSHAFSVNDGINIVDFGPLSDSRWGYSSWWYIGDAIIDSDVRLNQDKPWGTAPSFDVETVALHEFGHSLGLWHTSFADAVMHSSVDDQRRELHPDDLAGFTVLYPAPNSVPQLVAVDLNGDSRDDIVYLERVGSGSYTTDLSSWSSLSDNKFSSLVAVDSDADGSPDDLAGINLNQYVIYTNDLNVWQKSGANKLRSLVSYDGNVDGINESLAGINNNNYIVYANDMTAPDWLKSGSNKFAALISADLDGDGNNDDLAGINLNQYVVYATELTGSWSKSGLNKFSRIISADLRNLGTARDLVGINLNQYVVYATDIVGEWRKSGSNKFSSVVRADFDADGNEDDLAGLNLNQYVVFTSNITSSWTRIGTNKFSYLVSGDFDGDGANDDLAGVNMNDHVLYTTDLSEWIKIDKP